MLRPQMLVHFVAFETGSHIRVLYPLLCCFSPHCPFTLYPRFHTSVVPYRASAIASRWLIAQEPAISLWISLTENDCFERKAGFDLHQQT